MNFFEKIVYLLSIDVKTPQAYGFYHIFCIISVLFASIFFGIKLKGADDKKIDRFLFISSIIMLSFELYKQIVFSFGFDGEIVKWDYQWYAFPFQFCSVPMYVALITSLSTKRNSIKNDMYSFLGLYTLFAGLTVMLYPGDVFITTLGINIQTMVHHGLMVVIGVVMLTSRRCKFEHITIIRGFTVFILAVILAIVLDCIYIWVGGQETFNMFLISPYFDCHLPILSTVRANVPYPLFLLVYISGFTFCSYLILLIAMTISKFKTKFFTNKK